MHFWERCLVQWTKLILNKSWSSPKVAPDVWKTRTRVNFVLLPVIFCSNLFLCWVFPERPSYGLENGRPCSYCITGILLHGFVSFGHGAFLLTLFPSVGRSHPYLPELVRKKTKSSCTSSSCSKRSCNLEFLCIRLCLICRLSHCLFILLHCLGRRNTKYQTLSTERVCIFQFRLFIAVPHSW